MNLSKPFIERPIMTILVMIAILVMGFLAFINLPVADLPSVDYPTIQVRVDFPGASPETMASSVATPLEKEFMAIQGVENVTSSNTLGRTDILIQFDIQKNLDVAAVDVQSAISKAQRNLPSDLPNPPVFSKVNPSDTPILFIGATSETLKLSDLYQYASTFVGQRLSTIPGIAQVITYGAPYAMRVEIDPDKIAAKGITLTDVSEAVQNAIPNLPSGQLDGPFKTQIIHSKGQLKSAEEMNPVIIRYQNGSPVRIEDVGQAVDSLDNLRFQLKIYEGQKELPGVVLAIQKQPGANTLKVAQEIKRRLPELIPQIPGSIKLNILYDKSLSIEESVFDVEMTLIIALLLVVLVIFFYLGKVTDTLIPSVAMPMSIVLTFIVMQYFNFTIDNLSLLALVLATGFIVDDAIVVLENVVRHVEGGQKRYIASLEGARQISFTILSMTLSLAAVFVPLIFMYGIVGRIFYEFSVVMVSVILASGFISLTLTPMLTSLFVAEKEEKPSRIAVLAEKMNAVSLQYYKKALLWVMQRQNLVLGIGLATLILTLVLFWWLPKDFLPDDDIGFIRGFSQGAEGSSPDEMFRLTDQLADKMAENPNIQTFVTLAGVPQTRQALSFIILKPYHEREPVHTVIGELYRTSSTIPGLMTFVKNVPLINLAIGAQARGSYQYTLSALDTQALFSSAEKFIEQLKKAPGFVGVSSDLEIQTPELTVEILRDQASSLGVDAHDIENTLLLAFGGGKVAQIDATFDQYDVVVELDPKFRERSVDLSTLWVRSKTTNRLIPLSSVAQWKESIGPSSINHFSQFPSVTIQYNLLPGYPLSTALNTLNQITKTLPSDVIGSSQGAANTFESSIASSAILFLASIFAIYIVLGILYESFIHPLTILSTLPPAILGGLLTLLIFNLPLSLYSYLGLMLLIGIVKKNGILVVDFAVENSRDKGLNPFDAVIEACLVRFRPIMMTTLAVIGGALPIALGFGASAEARRPLGLVIIGGLLLSQLITLFLTPVIYLHLEKYNQRFSFRKEV